MFRRDLLLAAALAAATPYFAAAGDLAPGKPETATATVVLADLDLSTSAGSAQARERLTRAAERLCRRFRDDRRTADWPTYVDCVHDTVASALERSRISAVSVARN
jgi:UrcA family protein